MSDPNAQLSIHHPGVYEYYVEYIDRDTGQRTRSNHPGALVIEPRLYLRNTALFDPSDSHSARILLPLDGISILTVIPKWMPTVSHWPAYFSTFQETGYNMVHFAPLSVRGSSNSPYSIFDQLALADELFDEKLSEEQKEIALKSMLQRIRHENGILSVTDIVWNHTACNSSWLHEHPEAGYNLKTAPHLQPAFEIEEALLQFSDDIIQKYGKSGVIRTEEQLQEVMGVVKAKILPKVKIWEFYIVDVGAAIASFRAALSSRTTPFDGGRYKSQNLGNLSLQGQAELFRYDGVIDAKDGTRYAKAIDTTVALEFIDKLSQDNQIQDMDAKISRYEAILNEINFIYYREHDADVAALIANITTRARYLRVADHGPRLGAVSRE